MDLFVTLKKEEFEAAKKGSIIIRGGFVNRRGVTAFLFLSNEKLTEEQIKEKFYGVLANGHDVYYVNVSEWEWEQLDKPELDRIPYISFNDGVGFVFVSEEALDRVKSLEGENDSENLASE